MNNILTGLQKKASSRRMGTFSDLCRVLRHTLRKSSWETTLMVVSRLSTLVERSENEKKNLAGGNFKKIES